MPKAVFWKTTQKIGEKEKRSVNCEVNLLTFEKEFQSFGVHHGKAESGGDLLKQHEPIHGSPFSICQTRLSSIFLRYRRQGQNSWKESARYYQNILSFKILLEDYLIENFVALFSQHKIRIVLSERWSIIYSLQSLTFILLVLLMKKSTRIWWKKTGNYIQVLVFSIFVFFCLPWWFLFFSFFFFDRERNASHIGQKYEN